MSLATKAARGAVWTILTSIGGRALGVIGTLVITRFLDPDVVGEVGAAMIIVMTVNWLTTIGFGQYVIVRGRTDPGPEVVWHAQVANTVLGILGLGGVALLAGPAAGLVNSQQVAMYIPGMAIAIGIRRLSAIPEKLLVRSMHFRAIGVASTLSEAAYAATTVGFAASGHGGMSVVYGNIAKYLFITLITNAYAERALWTTPTPLSKERFKDMFKFGWPLAIESIAHNGSMYWASLAVRRFFGAEATGLYNLAYNLADIPAIYIGEQIGMVLMPSFAQLEPERRPRALERSTALLSLIIFPLAIGLGVVAHSLIAVALSPAWQGVAPLLTVLSVVSIFRPIAWTISAYLQNEDRTQPLMYMELGKIAMLLGAMTLLSPFGIQAAALAVGLSLGLHAATSVWLVLQHGPSVRRLLLGFVRPLIACAAMAAAAIAAGWLLDQVANIHVAVRLAAEILAGAIAYIAVALIVCRDTAKDLIGLVKEVVRRRRS